jgi:uncharacterized membrane protein
MSGDNRDLRGACFWAIALAIAVAVFDGAAVRMLLGLPMVLLISGHTLLRAIGVRADSLAEHLIYAIGASLVAGIAGGFVLNAAGIMTPMGWAIWYVVVVTAASALAIRRFGAAAPPFWPRPASIRASHAIAFALAASLTTGAYALAVHDEAKEQQFKYTEFWMLPSSDKGSLSLGIRSQEKDKQRFDVEVVVDGHPFAVFRSLEIAPGELWTQKIPVPQGGGPKKAEARLYRLDDMRLYRRVSAFVPGS